MITCKRCRQEKPEDQFPATGKSWCKACHAAYAKDWAATNRQKRRAINKRWRKRHPDQVSQAYREWAAINRPPKSAKATG